MPRKKPDIDYDTHRIAKFLLKDDFLYKMIPTKNGSYNFVYQRKIYQEEIRLFYNTDTIIAKYQTTETGKCKKLLCVWSD